MTLPNWAKWWKWENSSRRVNERAVSSTGCSLTRGRASPYWLRNALGVHCWPFPVLRSLMDSPMPAPRAAAMLTARGAVASYGKRARRSTKKKEKRKKKEIKWCFVFLTAFHGKSRCLDKLRYKLRIWARKPIDIFLLFYFKEMRLPHPNDGRGRGRRVLCCHLAESTRRTRCSLRGRAASSPRTGGACWWGVASGTVAWSGPVKSRNDAPLMIWQQFRTAHSSWSRWGAASYNYLTILRSSGETITERKKKGRKKRWWRTRNIVKWIWT